MWLISTIKGATKYDEYEPFLIFSTWWEERLWSTHFKTHQNPNHQFPSQWDQWDTRSLHQGGYYRVFSWAIQLGEECTFQDLPGWHQSSTASCMGPCVARGGLAFWVQLWRMGNCSVALPPSVLPLHWTTRYFYFYFLLLFVFICFCFDVLPHT